MSVHLSCLTACLGGRVQFPTSTKIQKRICGKGQRYANFVDVPVQRMRSSFVSKKKTNRKSFLFFLRCEQSGKKLLCIKSLIKMIKRRCLFGMKTKNSQNRYAKCYKIFLPKKDKQEMIQQH